LEMGESRELFAWAGFELPSSQSQPPEKLGLQVLAPFSSVRLGFPLEQEGSGEQTRLLTSPSVCNHISVGFFLGSFQTACFLFWP
jgi:hypothetical protein